jgi:5-amino-6-(5-phospho-D-ribitylamino)uracil phosphatase
MNGRFKLLVTDIDGTLVDKNGMISAVDRDALTAARRSGVKVSLCTGRAARGCLRVIEELSLDGFHIFCDGALVCNSDRTIEIYSAPIPAELIRQVCRFADRYAMALEVFTRSGFFISHASLPAGIHSALLDYPAEVRNFDEVCTAENTVFGCIVTSSPEEEERIREFSSGFSGQLRFSWTKHPAAPDYQFINVTAAGISKGRALEALIAHMGLDKDQVMAIGDGANDITLLAGAGLAVAMQHAPDDLKAVADYVTSDIEHHGVAEAIKRFIL